MGAFDWSLDGLKKNLWCIGVFLPQVQVQVQVSIMHAMPIP